MLQRQQEENAELKEKMRLLEADRDVAPDRISTLADSDAALTKDLVRVADKNGQQPRTISHPGPGQNSLDGSGSALDNQLGAGTSGAGSAQRALPRRAHQRDSAYSPANEQPGEGQERVLDRDEEQGSNGFHDEDDFVPFQSSLDLVDPSNANESFGDGIPLYPEKTSTRTKAGKTKRPFSISQQSPQQGDEKAEDNAQSLSQDTFSFLISARVTSFPFATGVLVFLLKNTIFTLVLLNLIDFTKPFNKVGVKSIRLSR